jgi:nicotinamide-nucleotide amidase
VHEVDELAAALHERLLARSETCASAESLTGGLVAAALTAVPGVSVTFRGGVVAYATPLKAQLLGVDPALLDARGPVDPDVALAMARGVGQRLTATWGLATTGVAGPDPQDGVAPGTVFVAIAGPTSDQVRRLDLPGGRAEVRAGTVRGLLELALATVPGAG